MNEQLQLGRLPMKRRGTTIMLVGGIKLLIGFLMSTILWETFTVEARNQGMQTGPTSPILTIPLLEQLMMALLLVVGLGFVIYLTFIRRADKTMMVIGSLPLLICFLPYLLLQAVADTTNWYLDQWRADYMALLIGRLLIIFGGLFLIIGLGVTLKGAKRRLPQESG
jgi:magnesium-transporting ATPase (P-type)